MRKTDQELMWEAFRENANSGPISTGGPLGGGSSKKSFGSSSSDDDDDDDSDDDDEDDDLKDILQQCCDGDLTSDEAYDQIMELMEDEDEDEEGNVKRETAKRSTEEMRGQFTKSKGDANVKRAPKESPTDKMRGQFTKSKGDANVKRKQSTPNRNVQGVSGRKTGSDQQGV